MNIYTSVAEDFKRGLAHSIPVPLCPKSQGEGYVTELGHNGHAHRDGPLKSTLSSPHKKKEKKKKIRVTASNVFSRKTRAEITVPSNKREAFAEHATFLLTWGK